MTSINIHDIKKVVLSKGRKLADSGFVQHLGFFDNENNMTEVCFFSDKPLKIIESKSHILISGDGD